MTLHVDPPDFSLNRLFLQSDSPRPRLRVGILADAAGVPRFARQVIDDIRACNFAEVVCVVVNRNDNDAASRAAEFRRGLAYSAYRRWISRPPPAPFDPVEIVNHGLPAGQVRSLEVAPIARDNAQHLPPDAVAAVRALDLDVLLQFGFGRLGGGVLAAAKSGVWSYRHADTSAYRGGPPMLWELIEGNPTSGVELQRLGDGPDDSLPLIKARFTTADTTSAAVNGYGPYWCTTHFVIQKLHELHRLGWAHLENVAPANKPYGGKRGQYRDPTNADMAQWLVPHVARVTLRRLNTLLRRLSGRTTTIHWRLGLRRSDRAMYEDYAPATALRSFRWIDSPRGHFWADPYLHEADGKVLLFFEDFDYTSRLGSIAVADLADDGTVHDPRIVLQRPYHLSYPQVFRHAGETWMVPESSESGAIELWRARGFPDDWVLEQRLIEIRAVDPTVVQHEGRWWLFATPMAVLGHFAQTYLWSADQLIGPWRLHEGGVVCSDVSRARPAGRIFVSGNRLVRPSQDCSGRYGRAIWFNEIERLDQAAYVERPVVRISSSGTPGLIGLHTYSRGGGWEAVDGLFRCPMKAVR